jgi:hypothetical protein
LRDRRINEIGLSGYLERIDATDDPKHPKQAQGPFEQKQQPINHFLPVVDNACNRTNQPYT